MTMEKMGIPITTHEIQRFKNRLVEGETIQYAICYICGRTKRIRIIHKARIEKKYPYVVLLKVKGKPVQVCMSYIKLMMATLGVEEEAE